MTFQKNDDDGGKKDARKYREIEENEAVNRWYLNLRAKSPISADVQRRNLSLYCRLNDLTPDDIMRQARDGLLKNNFQDFSQKMIASGKKGAYVGKFKQVLRSFLIFNDIDYRIRINIPNESVNETTEDERVPTSDDVARLLRKATTRGKVSVSLMAFSGFRPESLGNYEGNDGLKLSDLEDLDLETLNFKVIPARVNIRRNLSKARIKYFSFLGEEGCKYVLDYLEERKAIGEELKPESPVLIPDPANPNARWTHLRTMLVTREIRQAIRSAGLTMRPYVLRAYFATALDISEAKGLISHPWRQFLMGHKGNIEAKYSTNKEWLPDKVDEIRAAYQRSSQFFETAPNMKNDARRDFKEGFIESVLLMRSDIELDEDEKKRLLDLDFEDLREEMKKLTGGSQESKEDHLKSAENDREELSGSTNGTRQKVIPISAIEAYINEGFDFVTSIPGDKAIVKLP